MTNGETRGGRQVRPVAALLASGTFAVAAALVFRAAWHPPWSFYVYNIPIAVPFAAFFLDRWGDCGRGGGDAGLVAGGGDAGLVARGSCWRCRRRWLIDLGVLVLALLRVFAPPLPFASGHTLFAAYAAATARGQVLRVSAAIVLALVVYTKLFVTGGFWSMFWGLVVAAAATQARRRVEVAESSQLLESARAL